MFRNLKTNKHKNKQTHTQTNPSIIMAFLTDENDQFAAELYHRKWTKNQDSTKYLADFLQYLESPSTGVAGYFFITIRVCKYAVIFWDST